MSDIRPDEEDDGAPSPTPLARLHGQLRRMAGWRRDDLLRKLYKNAGMLLAGEGLAALAGLAAMALAARGLHKDLWGVLVIVQAYTHLIGSLIKFSTWEAVVKYGADALQAEDLPRLHRLLKFTALLDIVTALAGVAICAGLAATMLAFTNLPPDLVDFVWLYSLSALFLLSATPLGVLRLLDRFDLLASAAPVGPLLRLALVLVVYLTTRDLWHFAIAWLTAAAVDRLLTIVLGWRELHRRGLTKGLTWSMSGLTEGLPNIWSFAVANNLRTAIGLLTKELDTLIVAKFAGPGGAGLYRIAKQFSSVLAAPSRLLVVTVFPQLSKLWAAHDYRGFRRLIVRSGLVTGLGGLVVVGAFAVLGEWAIRVIYGRQYIDAYQVMLVLLLARVVTLGMVSLNPALSAMGRPVRNLGIAAIVALASVPALAYCTWAYDLVGAGYARMFAEVLALLLVGSAVFRIIARHIEASERHRGRHAAAD